MPNVLINNTSTLNSMEKLLQIKHSHT